MVKVYWAPLDNQNLDLTLAYEQPERLTKCIPARIKNSPYYRCPAFLENIKNTFVLKSPISLDFSITPSEQRVDTTDQMMMQKVNLELAQNNGIIQFGFNFIFFCDQPLTITQMHPYLHSNTFTENTNTLSASFNCGKWFRPLQAAFVLGDKQNFDFSIKRGDIFSYIGFDTQETVELINFDITPEIHQIVQSCMDMKVSNKSTPYSLTYCYNQFMLYRKQKLLLKAIKEQGL